MGTYTQSLLQAGQAMLESKRGGGNPFVFVSKP
jgi:hypothetical protein